MVVIKQKKIDTNKPTYKKPCIHFSILHENIAIKLQMFKTLKYAFAEEQKRTVAQGRAGFTKRAGIRIQRTKEQVSGSATL